jgi:hypothetical protein
MTAANPVAALTALLLAGASFLWLSRAGYGRAMALTLTVLAATQAGVAVAVVRPGHSLWLALGVAAVAASASAFAERESVRRIILVGGSLAAIQVSDPMGGLVAAGVLPATMALAQGRDDRRKAAGLYALLLFMPVIAAVLLLYLSRSLHIDAARLLAGQVRPSVRPPLSFRFALVLGFASILAPSLYGLRHGGARAGMAFFVAIAVLAAALFDGLVGIIREPVTLLAAAAPLTIVALAAWPMKRRGFAAPAAIIVTGLSWVVFVRAAQPALAGG